MNDGVSKHKKKINFSFILFFIVIGLGLYIFYLINNYNQTIASIKYNCTPVYTSKEIELNVNSTLVEDLYSKVKTNIKEDIVNPNLDNSLKLYLAYRQILEKDKYDSNCNLFSSSSMEPYTCTNANGFIPRAFKEETLLKEVKKLFGEDTNITLKNIQLNNSCIVGYQYIAERGEFVEGYCNRQSATLFKATKEIVKATSTQNTVILTEKVEYHGSEGESLPSYLKSGTYRYVFRLDMNYNYILIDKTYESNY